MASNNKDGRFYPTKEQLTQILQVAGNDRNPACRHINTTEDTSSSIPIINLDLLPSSSSSNKEREEEMEKLKSSLSSWGLSQVRPLSRTVANYQSSFFQFLFILGSNLGGSWTLLQGPTNTKLPVVFSSHNRSTCFQTMEKTGFQ